MGAKVIQNRIRPKYNPTPTAREKAYHLWLLENEICVCCWAMAKVVHHPLQRHPDQRWRRDHEYVVPMADDCHRALHANGNEAEWARGRGLDIPGTAAALRNTAIEEGVL